MEEDGSNGISQPQTFRSILYCLLGLTPAFFRYIYNKEFLVFLCWLSVASIEIVLGLYLAVRYLKASNLWFLFDSFALITIVSNASMVLNILFLAALVKISGAWGFPYSDTSLTWKAATLFLLMYVEDAFTEETVKYIAVKQGQVNSLKNFLARAVAVGTGFAVAEQSHNLLEAYYWFERGWPFHIILFQVWFSLCGFAIHCSTAVFIGFRLASTPTNLPCFSRFLKVIWIPCCYHFFISVFLTSESLILEGSYLSVAQACTMPLFLLAAIYFIFKTNHSQLVEQSYSRLAEGFVIL
ncbi:hypothetical protein GpartN1_g5617.t1 [Galdieria partita]|uniref:Uncharacterized protein n=1 Tax=Galdieria partita TaxID=83374 RepID=A0A9C7US96_9RHOD|nr:hypothetical protein GpartN1_g5617.t1 [Galdieria partita]